MNSNGGTVVAVSRSGGHTMQKANVEAIELVVGSGVAGDAHAGTTVQHLSRITSGAAKPNLRQVHLIHAELFAELEGSGFTVTPGLMGENVTTRGVDLLGLPQGSRLRIGTDAVVELTGLRNPCAQLDDIADGLMSALIPRDADGNLVRKAGVMSIVIAGGTIRSGDEIVVELPAGSHQPMQPV